MKVCSFTTVAVVCCWAAAPLAAQSLSQVDVIALQQQLRDDGCGVSHVSGRIDAMTRSALKKCASKYNASGSDAASVLAAMNIGFGPNDQKPTVSTTQSAAMGGTLSDSSASTITSATRRTRRARRQLQKAGHPDSAITSPSVPTSSPRNIPPIPNNPK